MSIEEFVKKLESLNKKRGQYAGNISYYQLTNEMELIEREIKRAISKMIRGY
jgi:hypothetical protein|tara:strand:- start:1823 stop:1978 length:156 start_codon:yes stop_codon:yes gene_type:complete